MNLLEKVAKKIVSWAWLECQPDGENFPFIDEHSKAIAQAAIDGLNVILLPEGEEPELGDRLVPIILGPPPYWGAFHVNNGNINICRGLVGEGKYRIEVRSRKLVIQGPARWKC